MNIKDFERDEHGDLVLDRGRYHVSIYRHVDMVGMPTRLWMTDVSGANPDVNICATYPRRIDAINGLDKLLRVFEP